MKLQKTSDYVLQLKKPVDYFEDFAAYQHAMFEVMEKTILQVDFVKQKLEKQMIVPCDADGNILQEKSIESYETDFGLYSDFQKYNREYHEAKKKVLFANVEQTIVPGVKDIIYSIGGIPVLVNYNNKNHQIPFGLNIIEDLLPYDVELTETAQKQLGYE